MQRETSQRPYTTTNASAYLAIPGNSNFTRRSRAYSDNEVHEARSEKAQSQCRGQYLQNEAFFQDALTDISLKSITLEGIAEFIPDHIKDGDYHQFDLEIEEVDKENTFNSEQKSNGGYQTKRKTELCRNF